MNYEFVLATKSIHAANGNKQSGVICLGEQVQGLLYFSIGGPGYARPIKHCMLYL